MLEKLNSPLSASIEITNNCNLNCLHCYNDEITDKEMGINCFDKIVSLLESKNVFFVKISGGEPSCHTNFKKICERLKTSHLSSALVTNGYLIEKYFETINETFDKVDISIDGDEKIHNIMRGRDCFRTIIDNLHLIKIKKVACATITKLNHEYIESIIDIALRNKFDSISLYTFKPVGKGAQNSERLMIDRQELKSITAIIKKLEYKYDIKINYVNPLKEICSAGKQLINILPNGNLRPCAYSSFIVGNIVNEGWEILWKKCQTYQNTCHAF